MSEIVFLQNNGKVPSTPLQRSGAFVLGELGNSHILQLTHPDKPQIAKLLQEQRDALPSIPHMPAGKRRDMNHLYDCVIRLLDAPLAFQGLFKQYVALDKEAPWVNAHLTLRKGTDGGIPWLNDVFSSRHPENKSFTFNDFSNAVLAYLHQNEGLHKLRYTTTHYAVRHHYHKIWGSPAVAGKSIVLRGETFATDVLELKNLPRYSSPDSLTVSERDIPIESLLATH
jgi:hypothetical protein